MGLHSNIFFLRRTRSFNKSRYSRNRQTARVIFYFGLLINVLVIFLIFSMFYGFVFKLAYWWFLFYLFLGTFILPAFLRIVRRQL